MVDLIVGKMGALVGTCDLGNVQSLALGKRKQLRA
jgi:hypothetical protein